MIHKYILLLGLLLPNLSFAAESWIYNNATVTGIRVMQGELIIYYKGGTGPCGGNGEFPFRVKASLTSEANVNSIHSAAMFAYASGKLISVYGSTCETIKQIRVHNPGTNFGAG